MTERHETDQVLTTSQLASEWGVSTRTIQRYIASGLLGAMRLPSGRNRIPRSAIREAIRPVEKAKADQ